MRKVITFLGKYPKETQYKHGGVVYSGQVFAEAMHQFVEYDEMLVFVTDEARAESWPVLAALNDPRIRDVPIRTGETTAEIWEMFSAVTTQVNEGETVIFDITHGLRSLPFLVFLFAAYLKSAKRVTIEAVYYGALELGDPKAGRPAPVIDMSEFVGMLDWLTASDRFIRFGDAQDLAGLLKQVAVDEAAHTPLQKSADTLTRLSQALRLIRPVDAMQLSADLPLALENARPVAQTVPGAWPYALIASDLERAYKEFALPDPLQLDKSQISLSKQRDLIQWYVERQQWVQAVSLAREWLVTWVMWHLDEADYLNQPLRESIAEVMSKEAQRRREAKEEKREFHPILLRGIPEISKVLGYWLSLAGVRNDIDHAGMREKAQEATVLIASVKTLCDNLKKLPLERQPQ